MSLEEETIWCAAVAVWGYSLGPDAPKQRAVIRALLDAMDDVEYELFEGSVSVIREEIQKLNAERNQSDTIILTEVKNEQR